MAFSAKLMVTLEEKDAEIERLTQAVALARSTAREELFPEMSSRIKAEREQARRTALQEAAEIAENYDETETLTAPKHIAAAIRKLAEEA